MLPVEVLKDTYQAQYPFEKKQALRNEMKDGMKTTHTTAGYCTEPACSEFSDEPGPTPRCAYHRDHQDEGSSE